MPTLICDPRSTAAELAHEYVTLRDAGEGLLLCWPAASPLPSMVPVSIPSELEAALEDEQLACLSGPLPPWLALDEFHRVLLLQTSPATDVTWLASLWDAGAEEVELLHPSAVADLSQSWNSGRRTAGILHRKPA